MNTYKKRNNWKKKYLIYRKKYLYFYIKIENNIR